MGLRVQQLPVAGDLILVPTRERHRLRLSASGEAGGTPEPPRYPVRLILPLARARRTRPPDSGGRLSSPREPRRVGGSARDASLHVRALCTISGGARRPVIVPTPDLFGRLIYFGADRGDEDSEGAAFVPSEPILRTARRWCLYQAREYFNASINEMWRRLTCWGLQREGDRVPIPMTEVRASLKNIDFASFASSIEVDLPDGGLSAGSSYKVLLDWVMSVGEISGELDDRWNLDAALSEDMVIEWLDYGGSSKPTRTPDTNKTTERSSRYATHGARCFLTRCGSRPSRPWTTRRLCFDTGARRHMTYSRNWTPSRRTSLIASRYPSSVKPSVADPSRSPSHPDE